MNSKKYIAAKVKEFEESSTLIVPKNSKEVKENNQQVLESNTEIENPPALIEKSLQNTIHMLQKLRHLCFEIGLIPKHFNSSINVPLTCLDSSEETYLEIETRLKGMNYLKGR